MYVAPCPVRADGHGSAAMAALEGQSEAARAEAALIDRRRDAALRDAEARASDAEELALRANRASAAAQEAAVAEAAAVDARVRAVLAQRDAAIRQLADELEAVRAQTAELQREVAHE